MIDKLVSMKIIGGGAVFGVLAAGAVTTQDTTRLTSAAKIVTVAVGTSTPTTLQTAVTPARVATYSINAAAPSIISNNISSVKTQDTSNPSRSLKADQSGLLPLPGVNISGGEFGRVPGRPGYDYDYPNASEIDYIAAQGFKMVRIPFRWERLQPVINGALSTNDIKALIKSTDYALSKGLVVVLDMHDYASRRPNPTSVERYKVGSAEVPASAFSDAWLKIAGNYRGNNNVWLGLMNEPNGLPGATWWPTVQQTVVDLRQQGMTNKLLVPGISWTGAHSWIKSGNAAFASTFKDPGANYAFEVHQYLDKDSSGTKATCSVGSAQRVDAVLQWAKDQNVKLFFGEIGAGPDETCKREYANMLAKLDNSQAVIGWTAWGAGKWWKEDYMFRLNPLNGNVTSHMQMLKEAMANR